MATRSASALVRDEAQVIFSASPVTPSRHAHHVATAATKSTHHCGYHELVMRSSSVAGLRPTWCSGRRERGATDERRLLDQVDSLKISSLAASGLVVGVGLRAGMRVGHRPGRPEGSGLMVSLPT